MSTSTVRRRSVHFSHDEVGILVWGMSPILRYFWDYSTHLCPLPPSLSPPPFPLLSLPPLLPLLPNPLSSNNLWRIPNPLKDSQSFNGFSLSLGPIAWKPLPEAIVSTIIAKRQPMALLPIGGWYWFRDRPAAFLCYCGTLCQTEPLPMSDKSSATAFPLIGWTNKSPFPRDLLHRLPSDWPFPLTHETFPPDWLPRDWRATYWPISLTVESVDQWLRLTDASLIMLPEWESAWSQHERQHIDAVSSVGTDVIYDVRCLVSLLRRNGTAIALELPVGEKFSQIRARQLLQDFRNALTQFLPNLSPLHSPPTATKKKPKSSTQSGDARLKIVAALTSHHKYADGVA